MLNKIILVAVAIAAISGLGFIFMSQETLTAPTDAQASISFHSLSAKDIDGKPFNFSSLKGKKVLVVNTASECGYTPQYKDLQALQTAYASKLVVIGFPCNQFGGQEPGTEGDIKSFCQKNYGVSFPIMEKADVKGGNAHPVYKWLTDKNANGWNNSAPSWNFCKYLIDENGKLVKFFASSTKPMDKEITSLL